MIEEIELAGDGGLDYSDGDWQLVERDLGLKQFPGKDVMLNFVLSAYDLIAVPLTKG